ncbi:MAG: hypothetical protein HY302_05685 [Opitutae bacterium]|nr:hypothetical protein [Opitutae bacterium]
MQRLVWPLLLALFTVLAPVAVLSGGPPTPAAGQLCCRAQQACPEHPAADGTGQPARDCAACLPGSANCCLAVLSAPDRPAAPLASAARLDLPAQTGLQRNGPPPLPPPRGLG